MNQMASCCGLFEETFEWADNDVFDRQSSPNSVCKLCLGITDTVKFGK